MLAELITGASRLMSYILSALKKSERDRHRGRVPTLSTPPITVMQSDDKSSSGWRRRPFVYVFLPVFLLINLTLFLYAGGFHNQAYTFVKSQWSQGTVVADAEEPSAVTDARLSSRPLERPAAPQEAQAAPAAVVISRDPHDGGRKPLLKPLETYTPPPSAAPSVGDKGSAASAGGGRAGLGAKTSMPFKPAEAVSRKPLSEPTAAVFSAAGSPVTAYIPDITQLPLSLRSQLPVLRLNGHIYSSRPSARRVIINGVSMRENQYMLDDLMVKEIVTGGVILDYRGQLFQLSLN